MNAAPELDVSIVVPAYCEERRLGATLAALRAWLGASGHAGEILVVDDGSTDATAAVCAEHAADDPRVRLIGYAPNRGKGYAVRRGLGEAVGRAVVFTDADLSTPAEAIGEAVALLAGADVVAGTRARDRSRIVERQAWYREGMGRCFNLALRLLGLTSMPDTQCGFKAFRRDAAHRLAAELECERYAFDVELLARAERADMTVVEQQVAWSNDPDSRVHMVSDSFAMLLDIVRIAWRLRGSPRPTSGRRDSGRHHSGGRDSGASTSDGGATGA